MFSSTKKWDNWIYNQTTINDFGPDCTVVTEAQIFGLNFDIWVESKILAGVVTTAINAGVLSNRGADFSVIYPWLADIVTEKTGEKVNVYTTYVGNSKFKAMLDEGYNFGLGLKVGNSIYTKLAKTDGAEITTDIIDSIVAKGGGFAHNHCFGKKGDDYGIFEIYTGKFIKCSIEALEYGVSKGMWRTPARTFKFADSNLTKALFNYKNEVNIENEQDLSEDEQRAIGRASKLRVFKA